MKLLRSEGPVVMIVMGVAGSGKTTIGRQLAEALGADFVEGDDHHSPESVEKMHCGIPLTDADRAPWLAALRRIIQRSLEGGRMAVVTCSALKSSYRTVLKEDDRRVQFVYLTAPNPVLEARLRNRQGHFLDPSLLANQLSILEPPTDAVTIDAERKPEEIVDELLKTLRK